MVHWKLARELHRRKILRLYTQYESPGNKWVKLNHGFPNSGKQRDGLEHVDLLWDSIWVAELRNLTDGLKLGFKKKKRREREQRVLWFQPCELEQTTLGSWSTENVTSQLPAEREKRKTLTLQQWPNFGSETERRKGQGRTGDEKGEGTRKQHMCKGTNRRWKREQSNRRSNEGTNERKRMKEQMKRKGWRKDQQFCVLNDWS